MLPRQKADVTMVDSDGKPVADAKSGIQGV